jgi:hypothetical protein
VIEYDENTSLDTALREGRSMASAAFSEVQISLIRPLVLAEEATAPAPATSTARLEADPWDQTVDDLRRLRDLEADWDGQGADAPQPANVDAALAWVDRMRRWKRALPPSKVAPGVLGEVHLVWQQGTLYLDAEICGAREVEWLLSLPGQPARQWTTDLTQTWLVGSVV